MQKIHLANLPTPIQKLDKLSQKYGKNIYLKRDDYTGLEVSGNKVRKLEYVLAEAMEEGADTLITSGSIQSNHCRATASIAAKLGLDCHLILREKENYQVEGNLFLDYLMGAKLHVLARDDDPSEYIKKLSSELKSRGKISYEIPVGASNAVGSWGYKEAYEEILEQEKEGGIEFDTISLAVGSGGTYAGLWYANQIYRKNKRILGFSVDRTSDEFTKEIINIVKDIDGLVTNFETIEINDDYVGRGYAKTRPDEIKDYVDIAQMEGVLFDPCYTGKAFRGLLHEIDKGALSDSETILFIHTGGIFGWTEEDRDLALDYSLRKNK